MTTNYGCGVKEKLRFLELYLVNISMVLSKFFCMFLNLCRNLFSIGQTSNNGLSFFNVKDRCELHSNERKGLIVLEGMRKKG